MLVISLTSEGKLFCINCWFVNLSHVHLIKRGFCFKSRETVNSANPFTFLVDLIKEAAGGIR